jgi:hypothetical protein
MSATLSGFALSVVDPSRPVPRGVVAAGGRIDAKRFAVYRNNVHVGLVGTLEARFPVVRRLVGEAFFTGMARVFVGQEKPRSPVLMHYGDTFPDFVAGFPPAGGLPYLADVARLEVRWSEAYNAADDVPATPSDLAEIPPDQLAGTVLHRHSAAALVVSDYAVGSIWDANQQDVVPALDPRRREAVLVARPGAEVRLHILPLTDVAFARALLDGRTIAEAAGELPDGADVGSILIALVALGAFAHVETNRELLS